MQNAIQTSNTVGNGSYFPSINITPSNPFLEKEGVRVVVGLTCSFSVVGSLLIIISFLFVKELRSRSRLILFHLSLMDFGAALANLVGTVVYFDQYYIKNETTEAVNIACVSQAAIALFCSNSSVLWTITLAIYLYVLIVLSNSEQAKYTLYIFGSISYILPLVITIWLLAIERLGYAPYDSSGWCSIIVIKVSDHTPEQPDLFVSVVGYDMWIILTMILVPIIYVAIQLYVHNKYRHVKQFWSKQRYRLALQAVDFKFTLIPIVFVGLRIWSLIISIIYDYLGINTIPAVTAMFVYLSGIGDSAQGAANGILFVALTKSVRKWFKKWLLCKPCCHKKETDEDTRLGVTDLSPQDDNIANTNTSVNRSSRETSPLIDSAANNFYDS